MTKEEALRKIKGYLTDLIPQEDYTEVEEIVKALEQEPCPYWDYGLNTCRHANIGALATRSCEDAVSREPRKIDEWDIKGKTAELWIVNGKLQIRYQGTIHNTDLPSVTPIRRKGEWLPTHEYLAAEGGSIDYVKCSCCESWALEQDVLDFCPYCGADMRGEKK